MNSFSATFSSPLGLLHNSHPGSKASTSILSLFKSSSKSSSSKKSNLDVEILPSNSTTSSTYSKDLKTPPNYYQAIGMEEDLSYYGNEKKEESKRDLELRKKEEKRAAKELKLLEADARMDKEFRRLGF